MKINNQHASGLLNWYSIIFSHLSSLYSLSGKYNVEEAVGVSKRTALANDNQAPKKLATDVTSCSVLCVNSTANVRCPQTLSMCVTSILTLL